MHVLKAFRHYVNSTLDFGPSFDSAENKWMCISSYVLLLLCWAEPRLLCIFILFLTFSYFFIDNVIRTHTRSLSVYPIEMKLSGKPFLVLHLDRCNRVFFFHCVSSYNKISWVNSIRCTLWTVFVCKLITKLHTITMALYEIMYAAMVFRASLELNGTWYRNSCSHIFFFCPCFCFAFIGLLFFSSSKYSMATQFFCNSFFIIESNTDDYLYVCLCFCVMFFKRFHTTLVLFGAAFIFTLRLCVLFSIYSSDKSSTSPLIRFDDDTGACVAYALCPRLHHFEALMSFYWSIVDFIDPDGATNYILSIWVMVCIVRYNLGKWCSHEKPTQTTIARTNTQICMAFSADHRKNVN